MSLKSQYVQGARLARSGLKRVGVLPVLDRWATHSRRGAWARSLLSIHDATGLVELDLPWWTFDASGRVDAFLAGRRDARVFEWGSGASTVWLAKRAGSVTAVEHHPEWAQTVKEMLPADAQVDLRTVLPGPVTGAATELRSNRAGHEDMDFREYAEAIDEVGGQFDVIVIDGRVREACLVKALPHLADDGIIVFDNVERRSYREAIAAVEPPLDVTWTSGLTPSLPYPSRTALVRHHRA